MTTALCNAGPLIALGKLNRLELLAELYERVQMKLRVHGTLGVLVQAYRARILSLSETQLLIAEIAIRPDIWISAKLCEQVLQALRTP